MTEIPVEEYLCSRIRQTEQVLMAHHEAALRGYGLTMTQYTVLLALSREDGLSAAQLARSLGVTQQSMAGVLNTLDTKGLIGRTPSPSHAKVQLTSLTAAGHALLDQAYQEVIALERALMAAFTPDEYRELSALLERAARVLVEQTPGRR
ncbi:MarR family winged helix-turn-helix transcriptional regulator [Kitasatospora viridis]|uniref:DNA-binding MarR family transcriptional regulator n=1 Tax=Kitasatospora viridis TaxID=281105 RepID=A0A561T6T8_9ACTN|nr:MarR family transcriptional regulator [Kitasatospora viridis]TWF82809.1 DNA-binding MarR family transcriptional regulator [Kitasatospora viridis]